MLSERDQRTLADIERQLTVDDPNLAAQLARWQVKTARRRMGYVGSTAIVILLLISFAAGVWWLCVALMALAAAWSSYTVTRRLLNRRHR
jgi:hypothetical protein